CEEQVHLNSVLMRLIDDLKAPDSIVHFDFSERRLELTATFSILTNSNGGGGGGGSVDVVSVVVVKLERASADAVSSKEFCVMQSIHRDIKIGF
ncbi:hypothetical protein Tco_0037088, partial [Tanacetum coccineum]